MRRLNLFSRPALVTVLVTLLLSPITMGQSRKQAVEHASAPVVKLDSGLVQGMPLNASPKEMIFKGIPYAAPPVGDLRWKPPQPVKSWQGVRSATEFGPSCSQPDHLSSFFKSLSTLVGSDPAKILPLGKTDEDCLYLNVMTGNLRGKTKQPVMFWIHGGSGYLGNGADQGANLVRKGVVVVTINYRLGVFGFLAHPALSRESPRNVSGNYGLLDMIEALKWVRRNIEAFGGDPQRITIFGESAGSFFVTDLLASPLAKGLFHRAIAQSGVATLRPHLKAQAGDKIEAEALGEQLNKKLGIMDTADVLGALRSKSAKELITAATPRGNPYESVVDGWVLPESPDLANSISRNDVPVIVGSTADEGTSLVLTGAFPAPPMKDPESVRRLAQVAFGEYAEEALRVYPFTSETDPKLYYSRLVTDLGFGCPSRLEARLLSSSKRPVYLYNFAGAFPGAGGAKMGAFHAVDLVFLFGSVSGLKIDNIDEGSRALAEAMQDYWVQFAATGNPNRKGLPYWPAYDPKRDQLLELGEKIEVKTGFRKEECDLLDKVYDAQAAKYKQQANDKNGVKSPK